jgi:hypothetical protein
VLSKPKEIRRQIAEFLQIDLDLDAMAQRVDGSLYRNRSQ